MKIDYHKCIRCKACYRECPSDVIAWDEEKDIPYMTYPDECAHCGICDAECPKEAINLTLPLRAWTELNRRYWG